MSYQIEEIKPQLIEYRQCNKPIILYVEQNTCRGIEIYNNRTTIVVDRNGEIVDAYRLEEKAFLEELKKMKDSRDALFNMAESLTRRKRHEKIIKK